jgi:uncharacterized repeat protein (TIGR01451 family)
VRLRVVTLLLVFLAVLASSIISVHATSVVYIKIHTTPSTFQDPLASCDGYTPGANIRYHIYLNVTKSLGGSVVSIMNLTITDTLPTGLTYVSGSQLSDPAAVSFSATGQVLVWNWSRTVLNSVVNPPEVPPTDFYEATVEFNATVDGTVPDNTYLVNSAQASYDEVVSHTHSAPGTSDTIWAARPILDVIKQGPAVVENGSSFSYTLTLNNTGYLDAVGINVSDFLPSGVMHTTGTSTASSGLFAVDDETQVVWTGTIGNVTGTHTVTITIPVTANTPAPFVSNYANYTAYPSITEFTHANATCTTQVLHPAISLAKIPSAAIIENSTSVTYTYNVTNTGDTPLSAVNITDSVYDSITSEQSLAVGQSLQFTKTVTLTANTTNTATTVGVDMLGTSVSADASATVTVLHPAISLTKVPSATIIKNNTSVTYTYNVTNTGDTPLSAVNITDSVYDSITSEQSLAVGQSLQFTKTVTLTANTTNTATTFGVDELATNVTATASATVTVVPPVNVTIVGTLSKIKIGESTTFTSSVSGGLPPYSYKWYLNGSEVSGATSSTWTFAPTSMQPIGNYNVYVVVMDNLAQSAQSNNFTVTVAPALTVQISPMSASLLVGQDVTFTATNVSGGYPPYSYQWYLDGNPVPGATSDSWTYSATAMGIYYVYLNVTDTTNNIAISDTARIIVTPAVPVGGYSLGLSGKPPLPPVGQWAIYFSIVAFFGAILSIKKRTNKPER